MKLMIYFAIIYFYFFIIFYIFRMFEPLHLASSDKVYPSKEGFYVVIISSIINELCK